MRPVVCHELDQLARLLLPALHCNYLRDQHVIGLIARLSGDVYVRPTQGSASGGSVSASAGTHDGGGAIDLAGQDAGQTQADREVVEAAGRQVGFAMFIRTPDQSDWPWHLHGIAVQPGGQWDQGCLSAGAHGQVVDYYEGRNGLASGAADDGPRDWVGTTWETYDKQEDDMQPDEREALMYLKGLMSWAFDPSENFAGPAYGEQAEVFRRIVATQDAVVGPTGAVDPAPDYGEIVKRLRTIDHRVYELAKLVGAPLSADDAS